LSIKNKNLLSLNSFFPTDLSLYLKNLSRQVSVLRFPFFIKLFLKGLGFRIQLLTLNNEQFLEFKLGFSHTIRLKITSTNIVVTVKKNSLILNGFSRTAVGNLANCIYNLRLPNVYTGKGFRYKRVSLKLKDVKKT
jgi:large subunit ribosomal protein L6